VTGPTPPPEAQCLADGRNPTPGPGLLRNSTIFLLSQKNWDSDSARRMPPGPGVGLSSGLMVSEARSAGGSVLHYQDH